MNDRFLPDKAIDALDEAGSRVHITNIKAPNYIKEIENKLNLTTKEKKARTTIHLGGIINTPPRFL